MNKKFRIFIAACMLLCLIPSVAVYATMKKLFDRCTPPQWLQKGILSVGGCTFGIYLIEQILRERGYKVQTFLSKWITEIPATLIYVTLVLIVGYVIVWILKRIPGVKRFI